MAYDKQTWTDGDPATPLSAARLTHIEDGIAAAQGAPGPAGPRGPKGEAGPAGPAGADGTSFDKGAAVADAGDGDVKDTLNALLASLRAAGVIEQS